MRKWLAVEWMRSPLTNAGCEDPSASPRGIIEGTLIFDSFDSILTSLNAAEVSETGTPSCSDAMEELRQTNHHTRYWYTIGDIRWGNGLLISQR